MFPELLIIINEEDCYRHILCGFHTVSPVLSNNGNWVETINIANHGRYYGVVFERAEGVSLSLEQMTGQQAEQWGKSLGSMHVLSESYIPGTAKRGSWLDALTFVSSILQHHPDEKSARQELEQVLSLLSKLPSDAEHMGLIHYDFQTDNLFYMEEESRFCTIDFDDTMTHWYAMDIVSAISDLLEQKDDKPQRKIDHCGYRSIRPLDEWWVQLFPLFQRFSDLYSFARLLRSIKDMDSHLSPEWAIQLKDKLLKVSNKIRARFHPKIELRPIDQTNWYAWTQLEVTDDQKNVFPVPIVYWIRQLPILSCFFDMETV